MKLYIIGNGFDIHFGLPTKISDFVNALSKAKSNGYYSPINIFENYGVMWGELENSLADLDIDQIVDDFLISPDYASDHEYDRDGGITNANCLTEHLKKSVHDALKKMAENANLKIPFAQFTNNDKALIEPKSPIINFNYTSTIEILYGMECFHIHGFYERGEELVFGYHKSYKTIVENQLASPYEEDHDYYVDTQKKIFLEFYHTWKKELQIDKLKRFLLTLGRIDEVVVLGHSISDVDLDYFELIEETIKPVKWFVSYHGEYPGYENLSFSSKVQLFYF